MPNYARARTSKGKLPQKKNLPRFNKLFEQISPFPPIRVAVVWPDDNISLRSVWKAAQEHIIISVLVGHEERIRFLANNSGIKIQNWEIHHSETSAAAAKGAVALGRAGKVEALMKGSLHTDHIHSADYRFGKRPG